MSDPGQLVDAGDRARIATSLEESLCVEAGAGTGKTTVLVDRVVHLLATGRVDVDQLVVITFTEKAAAELATRVRDQLEVRAAMAEDTERHRLLEAARNLYRAHIETIHAFAASLLRERPVEAGLDPGFETLDGLAGTLSFDAAYEQFEDELLRRDLPELDRVLHRGFGLLELREACETVHRHRYLLPLQLGERAPVEVDTFVRRFVSIAEELTAVLRRNDPGDDDKLVPIIEEIADWTTQLEQLPDGPPQERTLLFGSKPYTHLNAGKKAVWGEDKQRASELQREFRDLLDDVCDSLRADALLGVLPHVERFVETYAQDRRATGTADYDDLLFWARDLLRDSAAARAYFRRRYRAVLIDEFQDTDPVQAELALLLTSDEDPADWRTMAPGPGRLTVVGDPKQSIYRFRRADIAVYDAVKRGPLNGAVAEIRSNFRSNGAVLAALNTVFDHLLIESPGVQPPNVPLASPPGAESPKRPPVVLIEDDLRANADPLRLEEGRAIAGAFRRAREERWLIRRGSGADAWEPCRWGDMAILLPARTGVELFEEALAEADIPYRHEGSRDFFQRQEVRELIAVLSAIDDPTDRIALVGALRSAAFGLSDEDLVIHRAEAGTLSYQARSPGPLEHVNDALTTLAELHKARRGLSLAETVRRAVQRTRLVEFALTLPNGSQGAANLLAIVDQARSFAAAGGGGLRPFIRYLRDSIEQEADEIEATVAEETDDVVRIMTMHGAKGLEYPIVALANIAGARRDQRSPVPREGESFLHFHVGAKAVGRAGHFATPGYDAVWEQEKERIEAERIRLLYVAATRARDHLVVPCMNGVSDAGHMLGQLVNALPLEDPSIVERVWAGKLRVTPSPTPDVRLPDAQDVEQAVSDRASAAETRESVKERGRRARSIETASSRERARGPLAAEATTFGSALLIGEGPPLPIGDAVHMVMERISLPDADDLEAVADDVCKEGDLVADRDAVIAMCRACLTSPSVQQAIELGTWRREVPFMLARDANAGGPSDDLVSGRVDLVYQDGDELVVVDYKTDRGVTSDSAEAHAKSHHAGQAEVYAQTLAAATAMPVREVVFVYCRAGAEVALRAADEDPPPG